MKSKAANQKRFNHLKLVKSTEMVDLSLINLDESVQSRTGFNQQTIDEYIAGWNKGDKFPPVDLYFDGQTYWVGDGFHRIKSRLEANLRGNKIEAIVHNGSRRDAILHSVGANSAHGLRRTNEDKRHAVEILLRDKEWSQWSNREIARQADVSEFLVRSTRKANRDLNADEVTERLVQRNGKVFTQKIGNIGKSQKAQQTINPISSVQQEQVSSIFEISKIESVISPPMGIERVTGYSWDYVRALLTRALISSPTETQKFLFRSCWNKAFGWNVE
ncbi:MAG: hypothetical protein F6K28_13145 [Microcoleus sp. SIO2G3]|nr:hypothetical protein [Microcoleus sp. SIO2G3]